MTNYTSQRFSLGSMRVAFPVLSLAFALVNLPALPLTAVAQIVTSTPNSPMNYDASYGNRPSIAEFLNKDLMQGGSTVTFVTGGEIKANDAGQVLLGGLMENSCVKPFSPWQGKWKQTGESALSIETSQQVRVVCVDGFPVPPTTERYSLDGILTLARSGKGSWKLTGKCNLHKGMRSITVEISLELGVSGSDVTIPSESISEQDITDADIQAEKDKFNQDVNTEIKKMIALNPNASPRDLMWKMQERRTGQFGEKDSPLLVAVEHYFFGRWFGQIIPDIYKPSLPFITDMYEIAWPYMTPWLGIKPPGPRGPFSDEISDWGALGLMGVPVSGW